MRTGKKDYFSQSLWILFYIFIFLFLLKNSYNYLDPDLGWHLRVGEQILKEKSVPTINYFNYPTEGDKWVDHEWLTNAVMFWVYRSWGYLTLNVLMAGLILVVLVLLTIFTRKYFTRKKNDIFFILIFQFLGIIAVAPHLGIRVQEITLLFLLLLILIIYAYERSGKITPLLALIPLFLIWANLHGGFLIGLFVLFFWIFVNAVGLILKNTNFSKFDWISFPEILNFRRMLRFSVFTGLGVAATLLTPYYYKLYSFLGGYSDKYYLTHIEEWLPAWYLPIQYWQLLYAAIVVAVLVISFILENSKQDIKQKEKAANSIFSISLWHILLIIFFIFLSFKSKRHFPLLFVVSFPVLVQFCSRQFILPKNILFDQPSKLLTFIKSLLVFCFVLVIAAQACAIKFAPDPFTSHCHNFPCGAVEFLKQNPQYGNLRIFNQYGWGGYLIWAWPEKKLFIDGRLPQHKFAGHTYLEEYYKFFDEDEAENKLDQYNIGLALLAKSRPVKLNWFEKHFIGLNETRMNSTPDHLRDYLDDSSGWDLVYGDEVSMVYAKE